jgi:hypothetical protein
MSDTDNTDVVQPEAAAINENPTIEDPKTFDADYVSKLRAESAKYRTEAKANANAATRLVEIEEASKTDAQKLTDRATAAESKIKEYEAREQIATWKAEVSKETGVPVAALAGSSLEDITAHAEVLKSLIPNPADGPRGPVVTTEGTASHKSVSQLTETDLKTMKPEQINQARRDGRLNRMLGIT